MGDGLTGRDSGCGIAQGGWRNAGTKRLRDELGASWIAVQAVSRPTSHHIRRHHTTPYGTRWHRTAPAKPGVHWACPTLTLSLPGCLLLRRRCRCA